MLDQRDGDRDGDPQKLDIAGRLFVHDRGRRLRPRRRRRKQLFPLARRRRETQGRSRRRLFARAQHRRRR